MVKHCHWGECHSNSHKKQTNDDNIVFFPIPKPCKYFRNDLKDLSLVLSHDSKKCKKCKLAQAWINSCKVQGFDSLNELVGKTYYVCSLHFVDKKPTDINPIPISATSSSSIFKQRRPLKRHLDEFPCSSITSASNNECTEYIDNTKHTDSSDLLSFRSVSSQTKRCTKSEYYRKKIKLLKQNIRRKNKKIWDLKLLLNQLLEKRLIDCDIKTALESQFEGIKLAMIQNEFLNAHKKGQYTYSPKVREFAITLNFLSPKAYRYAKKSFRLPSISTIRKWNTVKGDPSQTNESFCVLKVSFVYTKLLCFGMDKKSEQFSKPHGKFVGYVDYGTGPQPEIGFATEALVIMATGLTNWFKVPIGYFLTNGLKGEQQAVLIKEGIKKLYEIGVITKAIVFDGCSANISTATELGVNLPETPFFIHPCIDEKIHVFLDNVHMIKLVRNALYKSSFVFNNQEISWKYIDNLYNLQEKEGFVLANKLRRSNVKDFMKQKMKTKLAVHVISTSTADALEFCRSTGLSGFENSSATISFIRMCDRLFDVLNAKTPFGKSWKKAISRKSISEIKLFFNHVAFCINNLFLSSEHKLLRNSRLRTFAIGYLANMTSLVSLSEELFEKYDDVFYFAPFRVCQDHLEHFFGNIRQHGYWSNNPTALHFIYSYRALVSHRFRLEGITYNRNIQDTTILEQYDDANSTENMAPEETGKNDDEKEMEFEDLCNRLLRYEVSEYKENVLYYMSGWISRSVSKNLKCSDCKEALFSNPEDTGRSFLLNVKQRGGLMNPSKSVFKIVVVCYCKLQNAIKDTKNFQLNSFINDIIHSTCKDAFPELESHEFNNDFMSPHTPALIKLIVRKFAHAWLGHYSKRTNDNFGSTSCLKNQLNRLAIFKNY